MSMKKINSINNSKAFKTIDKASKQNGSRVNLLFKQPFANKPLDHQHVTTRSTFWKQLLLLLHSKQLLMKFSAFSSIFKQNLHHVLQDVEVSLHVLIEESCEGGGFWHLTWIRFHLMKMKKRNSINDSKAFKTIDKASKQNGCRIKLLFKQHFWKHPLVLQGFPWGPLGNENAFFLLMLYWT